MARFLVSIELEVPDDKFPMAHPHKDQHNFMLNHALNTLIHPLEQHWAHQTDRIHRSRTLPPQKKDELIEQYEQNADHVFIIRKTLKVKTLD